MKALSTLAALALAPALLVAHPGHITPQTTTYAVCDDNAQEMFPECVYPTNNSDVYGVFLSVEFRKGSTNWRFQRKQQGTVGSSTFANGAWDTEFKGKPIDELAFNADTAHCWGFAGGSNVTIVRCTNGDGRLWVDDKGLLISIDATNQSGSLLVATGDVTVPSFVTLQQATFPTERQQFWAFCSGNLVPCTN